MIFDLMGIVFSATKLHDPHTHNVFLKFCYNFIVLLIIKLIVALYILIEPKKRTISRNEEWEVKKIFNLKSQSVVHYPHFLTIFKFPFQFRLSIIPGRFQIRILPSRRHHPGRPIYHIKKYFFFKENDWFGALIWTNHVHIWWVHSQSSIFSINPVLTDLKESLCKIILIESSS